MTLMCDARKKNTIFAEYNNVFITEQTDYKEMTKRKRLFTTLLMATTILAAMAQQKKITLRTDSPQANGEVMMYIQHLQ